MSFWDEETDFGKWNKSRNNANAGFQSWASTASTPDLTGYGELNQAGQQSWIDKMNADYLKPPTEGVGFNNSTFEGVGSLLGGVGSLAQAWAGLQGVKLGKERLAMQDQQFGANFTNQSTMLNNQINKHNNWATANNITNRYDNIETNYKNIG